MPRKAEGFDLIDTIVRGFRAVVRFVQRAWRRSLHFRVVSLTMLLGVAVVSIVSVLMYQGVADGLVRNKIDASQQAAHAETNLVQQSFKATERTDNATLYTIASDSVRRVAGAADDTTRRVLFMRSQENPRPGIPTVATGGAQDITPSADIRGALEADPDHQHTKVVSTDVDGRAMPAVMVGSRVTVPTAGAYDLYLIFPMEKESQALGVVRSALQWGSLALVLLLGGCAYLATRLVVSPVRTAARVAEQLAGGQLDERMEVKGEDDIARLGISFNSMASSLQRQIAQLEDLSLLQQRFTSDVSHELRTPLTTIRMAADMIHDAKDDFPVYVARSSELLSRELDRFEALLADLLEISRFDAGRVVLKPEPTSLATLCTDVAEMHMQLSDSLNVRLILDVSPDVIVTVDRRRIERIMRNLVSNAIEHAEAKPVVITLRQNATACSISVRDYGVGLKPGEPEHVFDRFWRADPARARTTGGTGLGLSISLEDARLHDGWLEAWGEPGAGSCFRLTLPRHAGTRISASPGPLHPVQARMPKEITSGSLHTSDPGARMRKGREGPFLTPKEQANVLPTTASGEADFTRTPAEIEGEIAERSTSREETL